MSSSEYGFVYIHGAGLDTWIWDDLTQFQDTPHLSASFPGRSSELPVHEGLGLQSYVDHIHSQIENWPIENVIVVSHSVGGIVGIEVASKLPGRIVGFVGLCAAFPPVGKSFLSCFPLHQRVFQEITIRLFGTKPPDSIIRNSLCADLSEEYTHRVIDQFTPESQYLYTDSRSAALPNVPTLYIKTMNDKEMTTSLQETMSANIDVDEVTTIESGHMPMLSSPQELASILRDFIDRRVTEHHS